MKTLLILSTSAALLTGCATTTQPDIVSEINQAINSNPSAAGDINSTEDWARGYILVQARPGLSDDDFDSIIHGKGGRSIARLQGLPIHKIEVPEHAEAAVALALSRNPNIKFAEKDMLVAASETIPNDPRFLESWHLPMIQAPSAWDLSRGDTITIAILDSGVYGGHPDLSAQMVPGRNVISGNADTADINGHGTAVAGLASATSNNGIGIASAGWNAQIMPIRITNSSDGYAYWSDVAAGLVWAADNGANVANISYRVSNSSTVSTAAQYMRNKGGLVVVAAGNENIDPGYTDNPYMITVAATNSSDTKASFSNYGNFIDVTAPGDIVLTTNRSGGYSNWRGTSFSSPLTAGVVGLIMSANPNLSPEQVETILEDSADDLIAGTDFHIYYGHGRINAAKAVQLAIDTSAQDTQAPVVTIFSPIQNTTTAGSMLIEVNASDDTGVNQVSLYANNQLVASDTTTPYQFSWDSTQENDGVVTLTAIATDSAQNEGQSNSVSITVKNQIDVPTEIDTESPTVSIINPADSSTVRKTVNISIKATDNTQIAEIQLYIDGALASSSTASTLDYSWNIRKVSDGTHTITAITSDTSGNTAETSIQVSSGSTTTTTTRGKRK